MAAEAEMIPDQRAAGAMEMTTRLYQEQLFAPEAKIARDYLEARRIPQAQWLQFRLGFAAPRGNTLLKRLDHLPAELRQALCLTRCGERGEYDFFRGRLMFPICGADGRTLAFGARALNGEEPKYINSGETPLYAKGEILYGLDQAAEAIAAKKEALVSEGYLDVMALHSGDFRHAVAPCGTALTAEQIALLRRLGAQRLLLVFDQDKAGQKAALKACQLCMAQAMPAAVVPMPEGDDPDSLIRRDGKEAFWAATRLAKSAPRFVMATLWRQFCGEGPAPTIESCARATEAIAAELAVLPLAERGYYINLLGKRLGLDPARLLSLTQEEV